MMSGDFVKVTHQCVPKGLVPDKIVVLHYEYATEGGTKWYAMPPSDLELEGLIRMKLISTLPIVDSHKIFMLKRKIES